MDKVHCCVGTCAGRNKNQKMSKNPVKDECLLRVNQLVTKRFFELPFSFSCVYIKDLWKSGKCIQTSKFAHMHMHIHIYICI
mmetsp:Transcript_18708/g.27530  ORF Transcript_18708/g.27530 Transcript_18708/m.27530 type:complete len:82 (+) Transcript_18708:252-497(+)